MANSRQNRNTLQVDTLDYIDRVFKKLEAMETKADDWREKRDIDLANIKEKVYKALDTVLDQQKDLQNKYLEIKRDLAKNTQETQTIKKELQEVQEKLNNMGKIELSTLAKVAWGGLTALAGAGISLLVSWITKKF